MSVIFNAFVITCLLYTSPGHNKAEITALIGDVNGKKMCIRDSLNASRDDMSQLLDMVFSPDDTVLIGGDQPATFSTEGEDMLGEALPPRSYQRNLEELDALLGANDLGFHSTDADSDSSSGEE